MKQSILALIICGLLTNAPGIFVVAADTESLVSKDVDDYPGVDRGNFLLIRDPLPLLHRILKSKNLRTVLNSIPELPYGDALEELLADGDKNLIPEQITIAAASGELEPIAALLKAVVIADYCESSVNAGLLEQLDDLQSQLISAIEDVRSPHIHICVRFRDENVAVALETQVRAVLAELLLEDNVEIRIEDDHVLAAVSVTDSIPATLLRGTLFTLNLSDDLSDPDLVQLADRVAALNIQFMFQRRGATLQLTIGPRGVEQPAISDQGDCVLSHYPKRTFAR